MKNKVPGLVMMFLLGCAPIVPDLQKVYPVGVNTALLGGTTVLTSSDTLVFESQLSLVDLYGHYDLGYLDQANFTFTSPGTYHILDFSGSVHVDGTPGSVLILTDESGDFTLLDPHNYRSKMINRLCQDVHPPEGFMVGAFSKGGNINDPVEFANDHFSTDWETQQDFIFSLANRTGGASSLYDAISMSIDKFTGISSINKHLVVLAHAADAGSAANLSGLINKAIARQIKIDVIFLGGSDEAGVMPQLTNLTKGILVLAPTDKEMITALNHFYRLISGAKYVYQIKVSYKPPSEDTIRNETTHVLKVFDFVNNKDFNPVLIYTRLP